MTSSDDRCLLPFRSLPLHESSDRRTANENRKASTSYSKLEKADILEMTVRHLRQIQTKQMTAASAVHPSVHLRYQTGFNECAQEVNRYLLSIDGLQPEVRLRLMNHLAECITAQPNHSTNVDRTTVRISPPPSKKFNDMCCVINRLPVVTCSNDLRPLMSQMQLSPVAMEQLRFRDAIGRVTSSYDAMPLSENRCAHSSLSAKVSGVVAHAHHRRDDLSEGAVRGEKLLSSMDVETSLEDAEVLRKWPLLRGKWRPLVERNNNSENISPALLNAISSSSPHPLGGDGEDGDNDVPHTVLRSDHFDHQTKVESVWRPW